VTRIGTARLLNALAFASSRSTGFERRPQSQSEVTTSTPGVPDRCAWQPHLDCWWNRRAAGWNPAGFTRGV